MRQASNRCKRGPVHEYQQLLEGIVAKPGVEITYFQMPGKMSYQIFTRHF